MIFLDVEAIGDPAVTLDDDRRASIIKDYGDPDAADDGENLDMLALSSVTAQIVCVGVWDTDANDGAGAGTALVADPDFPDVELPYGFKLVRCADEREMLILFWRAARRHKQFGSYNGFSYDLPVLLGRSLVHGIGVFTRLFEAKPWEDVHVDLQKKLTNNGASGWRSTPSLEKVAHAFGYAPPKDDLDGSVVEWAWNNGRRVDVVIYNCGDVFTGAKCTQRWLLCNRQLEAGETSPPTRAPQQLTLTKGA